MKEFRYKINPSLKNQDVYLSDIPARLYPGNLYNLDAKCGGDAQAKSGELREAMRMNWIHRVPFEPPKVRKVTVPKPAPPPKIDTEPTAEETKAGKVFDVALDLNVIETTAKGTFQVVSISGKGKSRFPSKERAIERIATEPELMEHIQRLCRG